MLCPIAIKNRQIKIRHNFVNNKDILRIEILILGVKALNVLLFSN